MKVPKLMNQKRTPGLKGDAAPPPPPPPPPQPFAVKPQKRRHFTINNCVLILDEIHCKPPFLKEKVQKIYFFILGLVYNTIWQLLPKRFGHDQ